MDESCWDGNPCTGPDEQCLPPGSPRPSGKTPDGEALAVTIPSPCETDDDCAPVNEVCTDGACSPSPCDSSDACDGYCVGGRCWPEPGFCEDFLKP